MPRVHSAIPACGDCKVALILELDEKAEWWLSCPVCFNIFSAHTNYMIPLAVDCEPPGRGHRWS